MAIENLDFRINAAIDAGNSAKTLGDLKTSLKELRDLAAQAGPENTDQFNKLATAAGEVNDKIKDVRESVSALSGTPMERLGNSFSRLRQSIFEMDLEKFKLSLIGIKDSFIALGAQALSPFRNLGVAISGLVTGTTTLTAAMRALGGAIAATGIGALVVSVGLLVAYWDDLKGAGGIIGDTFQSVSNIITSATDALKEFARTLGLIGEEQKDLKKESEAAANSQKQYTDKRLKALKDEYDAEKAMRDAKKTSRTDENKARLEDLQKEKEYQEKRKKILEEDVAATGKYATYVVELNKKRLDKIAELERAKEAEKKSFTQQTTLGFAAENIRRAQAGEEPLSVRGATLRWTNDRNYLNQVEKELNDIIKNFNSTVAEYNAKKSLGTQEALDEELQNIKVTNQKIESERINQQVEAAKKSELEKGKQKKETKKSDLQILEEMAATEDNFLKKRLKVQENWNRSAEEIDAMYRQIALEGEFTKSDDIFAEIDRRLQYQSDANEKARLQEEAVNLQMSQNKAAQFDLENLMISRNHDVFTDEMNYRVEIDNMYADIQAQNATWTSEMIYEEIRKRLQYQIDAYDAEKQAAIDKTNKIIDTARYGAQALDGINQFLYTLDENRRIAGEMTEKQVAKRAFERQKAFGIVNAAINTAAGITAVLASPTNKIDPTGTLMNLQIAFVSLAGAAQIAAIASQKFDPNSFGSTTPNSPSAGATLPTSVAPGQFVPFGEFKPGDLEERRVYVVESDITGIQRKVQVIENRSKF
jgi:hypothetical protein